MPLSPDVKKSIQDAVAKNFENEIAFVQKMV